MIFPKGAKQTDHFNGNAFMNFLVDESDGAHYNTVIDVYFEAGARNSWHMHPHGQILLATEGMGYYQEKGKPPHRLMSGDIVKVPARNAANNTVPAQPSNNLLSLRWPVAPKDITYMTGQMGVVVEGEYAESVKSLTQGNVISAGPWRKFGRVVIVETAGGYFYMYGGCESLSVKVGDRITPGMEVGRLGINAVSEKPQLFFMVFRSDIPIDPALAPRVGFSIEQEEYRIVNAQFDSDNVKT